MTGPAEGRGGIVSASYDTYLFTCAICEREVRDFPNRNGRDRHLAPICRYCEGRWGSRAPEAGDFMDRRKTVQISALSEALHAEALHKRWSACHGRA